jgi:hypothetical protein
MEASEKTLVHVVDGPVSIHQPLVRDKRYSSRRNSSTSLVFLPPSRAREERRPRPQTVSGWRSSFRVIVFLMSSVVCCLFSNIYVIVLYPSVPPPLSG